MVSVVAIVACAAVNSLAVFILVFVTENSIVVSSITCLVIVFVIDDLVIVKNNNRLLSGVFSAVVWELLAASIAVAGNFVIVLFFIDLFVVFADDNIVTVEVVLGGVIFVTGAVVVALVDFFHVGGLEIVVE